MARIKPSKNWPDLNEPHLGDMPQFGAYDVCLRVIATHPGGKVSKYRMSWFDEDGGRHDLEVDALPNGFWVNPIRNIMLDWINDRLPDLDPPPRNPL